MASPPPAVSGLFSVAPTFGLSNMIHVVFSTLLCLQAAGWAFLSFYCQSTAYIFLNLLPTLPFSPTPVLLPGESHGWRSLVGYSPGGHEESNTTERLHFHTLEKEMATHSSVLAWKIPGMEEPGGLPSMGLHRVGHDWSNLAAAAAAFLYLPLMQSSLPNSFTVTPPLGEDSLVASLSPNPITLIHFTQSWLWQLPTYKLKLSSPSVQFSSSVMSDSLRPHGLQHARPPCPSTTPGVYSNSRPLSRWCHPTTSSSVVPFSFRLESFPTSGSFPLSQFVTSGGQSIGVTASGL